MISRTDLVIKSFSGLLKPWQQSHYPQCQWSQDFSPDVNLKFPSTAESLWLWNEKEFTIKWLVLQDFPYLLFLGRKKTTTREKIMAKDNNWVVPSDRTKGSGHKIQEGPSEHEETLFYCEVAWALAQVAHGGCGCISILGRYSKAVWMRCWVTSSRWPSLSKEGGWTKWPPEVPTNLSHSVIL